MRTVQIPAKAFKVLHDRDVWDGEFRGRFEIEVKGHRVYVTGKATDLAALGDYIYGLADLVRHRMAPGTGISAKRWEEISTRFPTKDEAAEEDAAEAKAKVIERVSLIKRDAPKIAGEDGDRETCTDCGEGTAVADVNASTAAVEKHLCAGCLAYVRRGDYGPAFIRPYSTGKLERVGC